MARRVAQFYKVSPGQFREGFEDVFGARGEDEIRQIYDRIRLPRRPPGLQDTIFSRL